MTDLTLEKSHNHCPPVEMAKRRLPPRCKRKMRFMISVKLHDYISIIVVSSLSLIHLAQANILYHMTPDQQMEVNLKRFVTNQQHQQQQHLNRHHDQENQDNQSTQQMPYSQQLNEQLQREDNLNQLLLETTNREQRDALVQPRFETRLRSHRRRHLTSAPMDDSLIILPGKATLENHRSDQLDESIMTMPFDHQQLSFINEFGMSPSNLRSMRQVQDPTRKLELDGSRDPRFRQLDMMRVDGSEQNNLFNSRQQSVYSINEQLTAAHREGDNNLDPPSGNLDPAPETQQPNLITEETILNSNIAVRSNPLQDSTQSSGNPVANTASSPSTTTEKEQPAVSLPVASSLLEAKGPIQPRRGRKLFTRIMKKTEWNHLLVELSKVFLRYFLDLAVKDLLNRPKAGDDSTTSRKKQDTQTEVVNLLKDVVKATLENI